MDHIHSLRERAMAAERQRKQVTLVGRVSGGLHGGEDGLLQTLIPHGSFMERGLTAHG